MDTRTAISIAFIGPVSVGKTTLSNALFANYYSDMKMKRNTLLPQVFHMTKREDTKTASEIREKNNKMNSEMDERKMTLEMCKEIHHNVPVVREFDTLKYNIDVYEVPGVNDRQASEVYKKYISKIFSKLDIVCLVIDINSPFNTTCEKNILDLVTDEIQHRIEKNEKVYMITVINKCDTMKIINNKPVFDKEYQGLYDEIVKNVTEVSREKNILKYTECIVPIVGEDAFISRMCKFNSTEPLEEKYTDKMGINMCGRFAWCNLSQEQKTTMIKQHNQTFPYDQEMEMCGFNNFIRALSSILTPEMQKEFLFNKVKNEMLELGNKDFSEDYEKEISYYDRLFEKISHIEVCEEVDNYQKVKDHLMKRTEQFIKRRKISKIELSSTLARAKKFRNILEGMRGHTFIKNNFAINEYEFINTEINRCYMMENEYYLSRADTASDMKDLLATYQELAANNYRELTVFIIKATEKYLTKDVELYFKKQKDVLDYFMTVHQKFKLTNEQMCEMLFHWLWGKQMIMRTNKYTLETYKTMLKYCEILDEHLTDIDTYNTKQRYPYRNLRVLNKNSIAWLHSQDIFIDDMQLTAKYDLPVENMLFDQFTEVFDGKIEYDEDAWNKMEVKKIPQQIADPDSEEEPVEEEQEESEEEEEVRPVKKRVDKKRRTRVI